MTNDELDVMLAEQVAYYRARAAEYDATSPVPADDASRATLLDALEEFGVGGACLSLRAAPASGPRHSRSMHPS